MRYHGLIAASLVASLCAGSPLQAETAVWSQPDLDTWVYINGLGGGNRTRTPSFSNLTLDGDQFARNDGLDPARLASALVAFETSSDIQAGLDPGRYQVNSVTLTLRAQNGTNGSLRYRDTVVTPDELLSDALGSGITPELPIELFGVGFQDGLDGFALGPDQTGNRFAESDSPFPPGATSSNLFPVIGDGSGEYVDVRNNFTGGFSATDPSGQTDPFTATPWAIGTVPGLQPGDTVADDTTFAFEVDLTQPGVETYVQESLAAGALGFFVSSIHPAAQPGPGSTQFVYPQWFAREAVGRLSDAEAASLTIDLTLLPLPGDYNADGLVTAEDYDTWVAAFGTTPDAAGEGADGNGDGVVDTADYALWRDALSAASSSPAAIAVPEPAGAYTLAILATLTFCASSHTLTQPRKPR